MNRVHRVSLQGGIIGSLVNSHKRALEQLLYQVNACGEEVCFVVPDQYGTGRMLLNLLILLLTLLLWCPAPGYLVITKAKAAS